MASHTTKLDSERTMAKATFGKESIHPMIAIFLICAMSLPAASFTRPAIVSYHAAKSEQERLEDFLRKDNPKADVFITPKGQSKKLKEYGWERVPFTWRGNEIWIQRKPVSDQRKMLESA